MILPIVGGPAAGLRQSKASAVAVVLGSRVGRSSVVVVYVHLGGLCSPWWWFMFTFLTYLVVDVHPKKSWGDDIQLEEHRFLF